MIYTLIVTVLLPFPKLIRRCPDKCFDAYFKHHGWNENNPTLTVEKATHDRLVTLGSEVPFTWTSQIKINGRYEIFADSPYEMLAYICELETNLSN